MHKYMWTSWFLACAHFFFAHGHVYALCTLLCTYLFMNFFFVIHCHLMSLCIKFHKDLTILLFVILYNFEKEKTRFFTSKIKPKSKQKIPIFTYSSYATFPWKNTKTFWQFDEKMSPGEASLWIWFGDIRLIGMHFLGDSSHMYCQIFPS